MRTWLVLLLCLPATAQDSLRHWQPANKKAQAEYETRLHDAPQTERLFFFHSRLATRPHRAGTSGDLAVVKELVNLFHQCGFKIEEQELWVSFKHLRTARNTFVHGGVAKVGGIPINTEMTNELIASASKIIQKVREWLPQELHWPEFRFEIEIKATRELGN